MDGFEKYISILFCIFLTLTLIALASWMVLSIYSTFVYGG